MADYHQPLTLAPERRYPPLRPVQLRFGLAGVAGLMLLIALATMVLDTALLPFLAATGVYAAGTLAALRAIERGYPHAALGLCNAVTLLRLVLMSVLVVPLAAGGGPPLTLFALALAALTLDGLDGWLARRDGLVSSFGARFDVEVDAALALVLALLVFQGGHAGVAVLVLGLARYAFVAAGAALPWLSKPLPERFDRKVICVAQLGALIALQLPVVAAPAAGWLVSVVAAALIWSFGRDILWLWRRR